MKHSVESSQVVLTSAKAVLVCNCIVLYCIVFKLITRVVKVKVKIKVWTLASALK